MWRQGDVLIDGCEDVPADAQRVKKLVLAHGERTGHTHAIKDREAAELFRLGDDLYLRVLADEATVVHPEHGPVTLPHGTYRVWKQREFTEARPRWVRD